jgi:hypothetical protein
MRVMKIMFKSKMSLKTLTILPAVLIWAVLLPFLGCSKLAPTASVGYQYGTEPAGEIETVPVNLVPSYLWDDIIVNYEDTLEFVLLDPLDLLHELTGRILYLTLGAEGIGHSKKRTLDLVSPPSSVPIPTVITVIVKQGVDNQGRIVTSLDFGPEGLRFQPALKLKYHLNEPDGFKVNFFWLNENSAKQELQAAGSASDSVIVFQIHHFSQYTIWEETGGGSVSPSGQGPSKANKLDPPAYN